MTAAAPNLYTLNKLSFNQLKFLYPSDNLYKDDISLATHLTESLLVESMDWEDDAAVGETAFWLKVLSVPIDEEHRKQKVRFKREIYHLWVSNQTKSGTPNTSSNIKRSIISLATTATGEKPSSDDELALKRPRGLFEQKIVSPAKQMEPSSSQEGIDLDKLEVVNIEEGENIVVGGTSMTVEEWALIEASLEGSTSVVIATTHTDASIPTTPTKAPRAAPQTVRTVPNEVSEENLDMLRIYVCPHCQYKGVNREDLDRHKYTVHIDTYPIACKEPNCSYRAKQQWILNRHMTSKHNTEKKFKCSACEFAAKTHQEVQRHIQSKHEAVRWKCGVCDFECDVNKPVVRHLHMARVHGDMSNVHQCGLCKYFAATRGMLLDHINSRHSLSMKYACKKESCSYWSYSKLSTKQHMSDCFGTKTDKGGTKYPKKDTKIKLRPIHKYWCSECGMLFRYKQITETHITKSHHEGTAVATNATKPGTLNFSCSVCEQTSECKADLDNHARNVHEGKATVIGKYEEDEDYTPTYIRCTHCDFSTTTWCGMRSHIRANHSNDVYRCNKCDFMTHSKNGITSHKRYRHSSKDELEESTPMIVADDDSIAEEVIVNDSDVTPSTNI